MIIIQSIVILIIQYIQMGDRAVQIKKKKYKSVNKPNNILPTITFDQSISSIVDDTKSTVSDLSILKSETMSIQQGGQYRKCRDHIDQKQELKNLKKYFKKTIPSSRKIELFYSTRKPRLLFHYIDGFTQQINTCFLKDLLKANKQGAQQYGTISKVFDIIYFRVGEDYCKLQSIGVKLAEKQRVQLAMESKKQKVPLLYYEIDGKIINFALFDCKMRMFEFNNGMIEDLILDKQEQKLWKRFNKEIENSKRINEKIVEDTGCQFQVQSDGEKTVNQEDLNELQRRLRQLLATDCKEYEDEINNLDQRCNDMIQAADHRRQKQLEHLTDKVYQLQHNLDNFVEVREKVRQEANLKNRSALKYLVKRMIVAERQLSSRLPILARKREIFQELSKKDLLILEGETGSGKSTQLPQMLCEYYNIFNDPTAKPVLITQPRKLATRTVAQRVAHEMQQSIGGFVDYATTAYKQIAPTAKIVFKLDSVVLDELTADRILSRYCCLIIDEAHERTISIDVILGLVKELQQKRKNFKVIVTSASLDAKLFSDFFGSKVMKVSGRLFPVQIIYRTSLEHDIVHKIEKIIKKDILVGTSEMKTEYKGDLLVFCTGVDEITYLQVLFQKYLNPRVFRVYALHGRVAVKQQKLVFMQTKEHKIIFASRIAETSITINGVRVVVDPGFDRQLVYDQKNRVSSRKLIHISQSSAKQRAGRAGRTSNGYCFRIYSQGEYNTFRPNKTPEIDNMALDTLVLRLKSLGISQVQSFSYIKQPQKSALQQSVQTLKMIGGLSSSSDITTIGRLLLQLQIEPFLGRSVVEAIFVDQILNNTDFANREMREWTSDERSKACGAMISVVQILSMVINSSNLFFSSMALRQHQEEVKFRIFSDQRGDFFFLQRIYNQFYGRLRDSPQALNSWIYKHFLNKKVLFQTKELVQGILQTIGRFKLDFRDITIRREMDSIKFKLMSCKKADQVVLSCMMTSFCVNLCLYSQNPAIGYTLVLQKKPIMIHGTSTLSLLSIFPKWIVCYDLRTSDKGVTSCAIAHEVDFHFLKNTVQDYVFDKLQLGSAQKMNPFYETIERILPTLIVDEISSQYANRCDNNIQLFDHLSVTVKESTNTLAISFSKGLTVQDIFPNQKGHSSISVKEYIQNYVQQKRAKCSRGDLRLHLLSNIYLQISNGLKIKRIRFHYMEAEFLITANKYILFQLNSRFQNLYTYQYQDKLKVITTNQEDHLFVNSTLQQYDIHYNINIKEDNSRGMCNARVFMHFYTGTKRENSSLLLLFGSSKQKASRNCEILSEAKKNEGVKSSEQKYKYLNILSSSKFKLTKTGNAVNCYNQNIDAFQLQEALQNLCNFGVLPFDFTLPTAIRQFTQSQPLLAMRSERQWQKVISDIFQKHKLMNLQVKVKKDASKKNEPQQRIGNAQTLIKQILTAQISTSNMETLNQLIRKFDGKEKVVGCGKVHFRYNFKQHIAKINKRAFTALSGKFNFLKELFQNDPQIKIETQDRRFGRVQSVFISCRSPSRQKLLKPTQRIKQLFSPFILRLQQSQFNFLCTSLDGDNILDGIEDEYSYDIYFGFDRKLGIVKIYCEQDQFQKIQTKINNQLTKYEIFLENISYKGKGLKKVVNMLEDSIKSINVIKKNSKQKHSFLQYRIIFKKREIELNGDKDSLAKAKLDIQKMANQQPGSCHICMKNTERPYMLFACRHSFCWTCIADYIDELRKDETNQEGYPCPEDGCNSLINSADIKTFLSADQFQYLCLKRVKEYVNKSKQYFTCPTPACQQIFQIKKIRSSSSFDCPICGKWFCSTCRQPHEHFSCKEWSDRLDKGELAKFGFRKCKCGHILQKEMRLKHIQCKQCKEYLCWTCIKSWRMEKDCINHTKVCKK